MAQFTMSALERYALLRKTSLLTYGEPVRKLLGLDTVMNSERRMKSDAGKRRQFTEEG